MKKNLMLLGLVGLGFIGCGNDNGATWQMGAFQQGNKVIKTYCDFNHKEGFRYVMQYMTIDESGKASLAGDDEVKGIFEVMKNTRLGASLEKPFKSQILSIRKDDPSFCAGFDMMMSFSGAQRMQGIGVERQ